MSSSPRRQQRSEIDLSRLRRERLATLVVIPRGPSSTPRTRARADRGTSKSPYRDAHPLEGMTFRSLPRAEGDDGSSDLARAEPRARTVRRAAFQSCAASRRRPSELARVRQPHEVASARPRDATSRFSANSLTLNSPISISSITPYPLRTSGTSAPPLHQIRAEIRPPCPHTSSIVAQPDGHREAPPECRARAVSRALIMMNGVTVLHRPARPRAASRAEGKTANDADIGSMMSESPAASCSARP